MHAIDQYGLPQRNLLRRHCQPQRREAPEQRCVGDAHLHAGKLLVEALVDAVAKATCPVAWPGDVKLARGGEPSQLDLRGLGLDTVTEHPGHVEIGAMATYRHLLDSPLLARSVPLLPRMAAAITGGEQIRNLGTIGGSACFANPSSEVPAVLVALGATLRLHGPAGYRDVAAAEFFHGAFATDLAHGEFLTSLHIPHRHARNGYHKLKLSEGSWPIVTAVATVDPEQARAEVTIGAAQAVPVRIDLSTLLDGAGGLDLGGIDALVRHRIDDPWSDVLADGTYRREVAGAIARRAVTDLLEGPNR